MRFFIDPPILATYRRRAAEADINEMSGRTGQPIVTERVSENIVKAVAPNAGDTIIDIGCGDGSLLIACNAILKGNGRLIGVLPTDEELTRVRAERPSPMIEYAKGAVTNTSLPSGLADKTICNSVLLYIPRRDYGRALQELRRITKPGGIVFVGEVLLSNERISKNWFDSLRLYLKFARARISWCDRPSIIEMARRSGLELIDDFKHEHFHRDGSPYILHTRRDYIFLAI